MELHVHICVHVYDQCNKFLIFNMFNISSSGQIPHTWTIKRVYKGVTPNYYHINKNNAKNIYRNIYFFKLLKAISQL